MAKQWFNHMIDLMCKICPTMDEDQESHSTMIKGYASHYRFHFHFLSKVISWCKTLSLRLVLIYLDFIYLYI